VANTTFTNTKLFMMMFAVTGAALSSSAACVPRARMCTASSECSDKSACVAGRCQLDKATVKPAVDSARRIVVRPVDIAYVKSGDAASGGALPSVFVLGKDGGKLFLRFAVTIPSNANIVEAYVVLRRSTVVDDDPAPVSLHATRIVESWSGGSMSWALQPRSTESRSPSTLVEPGGSGIVRLDVRELVRQWARHDPTDQGIAVIAENETRSGSTFALSNLGAPQSTPSAVGLDLNSSSRPATVGVVSPDVEPFLELYVR
jgi:hypothetical protein